MNCPVMILIFLADQTQKLTAQLQIKYYLIFDFLTNVNIFFLFQLTFLKKRKGIEDKE